MRSEYDGPLTHVYKRRGKKMGNWVEAIGLSEMMKFFERINKKVTKGEEAAGVRNHAMIREKGEKRG